METAASPASATGYVTITALGIAGVGLTETQAERWETENTTETVQSGFYPIDWH